MKVLHILVESLVPREMKVCIVSPHNAASWGVAIGGDRLVVVLVSKSSETHSATDFALGSKSLAPNVHMRYRTIGVSHNIFPAANANYNARSPTLLVI